MEATGTVSRKIQITCAKCQGRGVIARFSHQHQGVCYDCNGAGKVWDYAPELRPASAPDPADQEVAELCVTFRQIARWLDEAAYARTATTYNMEDPARYYASRTAGARAYEAQMAMTHPERVAFNAYYASR